MLETQPFWREKSLSAMSRREWESLCDGCGRCCLHKLRDEDTDEISFHQCRLPAAGSGQLPLLRLRLTAGARVHDCVQLTPAKLKQVDWLPPSCAYRLIFGRQGSVSPGTRWSAARRTRVRKIRRRDQRPGVERA